MNEKFVPFFNKVVDSSLWLEEDFVIKVFLTMIFKKDKDNVVRGNAFNIGRWANKDEKEVEEAIKILCSPDMKRGKDQQMFDGRRLQRVEDGWLILNGQYYHNLMRIEERREYNKRKQAEYRRKKDEKKLAAAAPVDPVGDVIGNPEPVSL